MWGERGGMEQRNPNAVELLESNCFFANSKLGNLINHLTKMSKNPTIESDLSQTLDEFLQKLNECEKYLENGIFNMNFAEAALLLQSSADIYSKKVDLLWDIIFDYQKRILLNDDQTSDKDQEIEKLEERKRKYKRKRKAKENETQTTKLVNCFSFGNSDTIDYLNQSYEQNNFIEFWKKNHIETINNHNDHSSNKHLFLPNNSIYTEDNEYVGRYDQFHSASLIEDIFNIEQETLKSECVQNENQHVNNLPEKDSQVGYRNSYVVLERLPFNILKEKLRRASLADSLFDDDNFSSISDCHSPIDNEITAQNDCDGNENSQIDSVISEQIAGNLDKRNKSCSQDSAFYEFDEDTPLSRSASMVAIPINNYSIVIPRQSRVIKRKSFMHELTAEDLQEEVIKKRKSTVKKRISEKLLKKLSTGVTVVNREFEKFCRLHYKPGENEGTVPSELTDSEDSDEEENHESSDEEENHNVEDICHDPTFDTEEEEEIPEETTVVDHPSENVNISGPSTSKIVEVHEKTVTIELSPEELEEEEASRKRVREWRSFILPKLKNLENKSDFDIHEYGSKIIDPMKIGEDRNFEDIVQRKSPAEVTRYFIAILQLANTNNVEIMGAIPGQISNSTFQVKTLDKTRHHELLDDYQAPSEETFRERLEKVKAMNPKMLLHSTPNGPPMKKIKSSKTSRKQLF